MGEGAASEHRVRERTRSGERDDGERGERRLRATPPAGPRIAQRFGRESERDGQRGHQIARQDDRVLVALRRQHQDAGELAESRDGEQRRKAGLATREAYGTGDDGDRKRRSDPPPSRASEPGGGLADRCR